MKSFSSLERLVAVLTRLPGIGRRSARRIAFKLVAPNNELARDLQTVLKEAAETLTVCSACGALTTRGVDPCACCTDPERDPSLLCVVEDAADVLTLDAVGGYRGHYFVLGGRLSPRLGMGVERLRLEALEKKISQNQVREVILALGVDVESDATASFLGEYLQKNKVCVTRPAMGLPAGSGIAYADAVTLARAMQNRQSCQEFSR